MNLKILILSIALLVAIIGCSSLPTQVSPVTASQPAALSSSSTTQAGKQNIQVDAWDDFFRPEKITITVGTTVTWINVGKKKHNIAFDHLFDNDIQPGEKFSYTFDKPGVYQYYCVIHSESDTDGMVGTITVTP